MGLDMYLYAKKYIYTHQHQDNPLLADLVKIGLKPDLKEISVEAGYWRNANATHDWFVKNVQDGEDNCGTYSVSRKQLTELKEACQSVLLLPTTAAQVLPTSNGFFFGSTEYDDWYYEKLRSTVRIVNECLSYPDDWFFYYSPIVTGKQIGRAHV